MGGKGLSLMNSCYLKYDNPSQMIPISCRNYQKVAKMAKKNQKYQISPNNTSYLPENFLVLKKLQEV